MKDLATFRATLGLSQRQFAMQLGISQSLLAKIENGTRSLPDGALQKMTLQQQKNNQKTQIKRNTSLKILENDEYIVFKAKHLVKISNKLRLVEIKLETEQLKMNKLQNTLLNLIDSQANDTQEVDSIAYLESALAIRKLRISYSRLQKIILLIELNLESLKAQKVHLSK